MKIVAVFGTHPEVRKVVFAALGALPSLRLVEPVDLESNLHLQSRYRLVITNSGGIQDEAPYFGIPTVVMREHTERGEGIAAGFAALACTDTANIIFAAEQYVAGGEQLKQGANPYGDCLARPRILATLMGQAVESFHG